jgi:hypothetical protein
MLQLSANGNRALIDVAELIQIILKPQLPCAILSKQLYHFRLSAYSQCVLKSG